MITNDTSNIKCKICKSLTEKLFKASVLNKFEIDYMRCSECGFVQTENCFRADETYKNAISSLDVGLVSRNIQLAPIVESIILQHFDYNGKFLDFAGGYGLFVRLMRDRGFDFYRQDIYCENIFAMYFDINDLPSDTIFDLVTAFEVLEHSIDPLNMVKEMLSFSNSVLFSTELLSLKDIYSIQDWWYFMPETGQHISFYTESSLKKIAEYVNCNLYSNHHNLHLITSRKLSRDPFRSPRLNFLDKLRKRLIQLLSNKRKNKPDSLLLSDFEMLKSELKK